MSVAFLSKCRIVAATALATQFLMTAAMAFGVDVDERPLNWIKPGTVVDRGAHRGWSHLIYVAHPRVGSGDVEEVGRTVKDHARLFTVAVTANVVQGPNGSYRFDKVGVGIGTLIQRKNTIINSDKQKELGANLGFIARQILANSEKNFATGNTQVARTDTMIVFDSKVMLMVKGEHREMISRCVLLVPKDKPQVGMLRWMFDADYNMVNEPMQYLKVGFQEDQVLNVKADEFFFGIPGQKALAQVKMYDENMPIEFTPALKPLAAQRRYTVGTAKQLESELWKLWGPAPAARSNAEGAG